jgi:Uma2 family endonuclease
MSATTAARPTTVTADDRVVLPHVSWKTYERLLADDDERRVPRMTYDQGVLELLTPSMPHEEDADILAEVVKLVSASLGIPIRSTSATTFKRADLHRGFEPDASFYIQSERLIRGKRQVDLLVDPPPDLILEMEMSRTVGNKLPLFASMGIPELWRCNGERMTILILELGSYRESCAGLACLASIDTRGPGALSSGQPDDAEPRVVCVRQRLGPRAAFHFIMNPQRSSLAR